MDVFSVIISLRAEKSLRRIPKEKRRLILNALKNLEQFPQCKNTKKLKGKKGWRMRIGSYHAFFVINTEEKRITTSEISTRQSAY